MMSNKELTPYQKECLTILMEECGETVQEICKIFRFGPTEISHHQPNKNHITCLMQELGDILAMIELVTESNIGITTERLHVAKQIKLVKVKKWMKNKKPQATIPNSTEDVMLKALDKAKKELNNYKEIK